VFEYFAGNYVWNLAVNLALAMGAPIGEIDEACRPLLGVAASGVDTGTERFFLSWRRVGDRLVALAKDEEDQGRLLSAGEKYGRAAVFYLTAERMQSRHYEPRKTLYEEMLSSFSRYLELTRQPVERIEVPYEGGVLAGYLHRTGEGADGRVPCMIFVNGLDSTKEMVYRCGFPEALGRRGISTFVVDQPGSGEALRIHALTAIIETERWVRVIVDHLENRTDLDPDRIGLMGWSMAGYYVPRATAFEPRVRLCAVLGANFDWAEVNRHRMERSRENPVPHYWEHCNWVWGQPDTDSFMQFTEGIKLAGVIDRIKVPALIVHGENDRQIAKEYAYAQFQGMVNSPKRELKITGADFGGVEHCSADNLANARDYIADWVAETFATATD
jgi:pimeloyl-ACP methyl ester carboxylesterase